MEPELVTWPSSGPIAGGSVLLDVYSLNVFEQREEAVSYEENPPSGFWAPEKCYGFLNTFRYMDAKVVLDKYTIVDPERTRTVYNWLQCFSPESRCAASSRWLDSQS